MSYQPTAEGRAGNYKAALDIQVDRVKEALDQGSKEMVLYSFGNYAVIERIVKAAEEPIIRLLAKNAREEIYAYMRKKGFDIDSLVP